MKLIDAEKELEKINHAVFFSDMETTIGVATYRGLLESAEEVNIWSLIFDELIKCHMFRMEYDAKNGNEHYMYGIATVMDFVADKAGREDEYTRIFNDGLNKSYEKAGIVEDDFDTPVILHYEKEEEK